jgi:uncharacterized membrane protein required for colicin V production
MSLSVAIDAAVLMVVVLGAWSGWSRGAARMIVSMAATVVGLLLAAYGRAPLADVLTVLIPDIDQTLVSLFILVGGAWIALGIASWVLGNLLRGALQALRLGLFDSLIGALLGAAQSLVIASVALFGLEALRALGSPLPEPIALFADAAVGSQSAAALHALVYPFIWSVAGSTLPTELQQLLRP